MPKNRREGSIKRFVVLALILIIIGVDTAVDAQSRPEIFKIENITASLDKQDYFRNEIIQVKYNINCSGKIGDKFFIFKANNSFNLCETRPHKPDVIYPSGIGNQSEEPHNVTLPGGFKGYYVPLFDNNSESKGYLTKITINISPTSECKLNRTFDLTDRSFVEIKPTGERIPSPIKIINKNPGIKEFVINEKRGIAKYKVHDDDSALVNWSLCKNGRAIHKYNGDIIIDEDLLENNIDISKWHTQMTSLKLHLIDSDGGEYWSIPLSNWPKEEPSEETLRRDYSIFILGAIVLSVLSFNSHSFRAGHRLAFYLIVVLIFHYILFKANFIFLSLILIAISCISNYWLHQLSMSKESEEQQKKFVEKWTLISGLWFYIIMVIAINYSSIDIVEQELNYLATIGVCITFLSILLAIFATDKLSNLKKYAKKFELAAGIYCILWIVFYFNSIRDTYIISINFVQFENLLIILYLTFFSLILLPALIYFYFAPEK